MTVDGDTARLLADLRVARDNAILNRTYVSLTYPFADEVVAALARLEAENGRLREAAKQLIENCPECGGLGSTFQGGDRTNAPCLTCSPARAALGLEGSERDKAEAGGSRLGASAVTEDSQ